MCKTALPTRLLNPATWIGTDDDNKWMRWRIPLKWLFAFGPRSSHWLCKWRRFPKILFKMKGTGVWRYEADETAEEIQLNRTPYLSRIQYYCRWHIQITWPLMVAFHFYFKPSSVLQPGQPNWGETNTDGKLFYFYIGTHRDSDVVYWFPSAFLGFVWK